MKRANENRKFTIPPVKSPSVRPMNSSPITTNVNIESKIRLMPAISSGIILY